MSGLKEEVSRAQRESGDLRTDMAALKDKLNVSEVCKFIFSFEKVLNM